MENDFKNMTVNERLKLLRKQHLNLSQKKLGESINVSNFAISDIEKGKSNLTERNLNAICEQYGVKREWLLDGEGDKNDPFVKQPEKSKLINIITKAEENNDVFLQNFIIAYDKLKDEQKEFIFTFIKDLYESTAKSKETASEKELKKTSLPLEQKAIALLEEENNNDISTETPDEQTPTQMFKNNPDLAKIQEYFEKLSLDAKSTFLNANELNLQKKQTLSQSDWQEENQDENQTG